LFNVAIEKPIFGLLPLAAAEAGAGALAGGLALSLALLLALLPDDAFSLLLHPASAAAHSSNAPVDLPNVPQLSNRAELQAMTVSFLRVVHCS
jgi:hypothetical protein